jgi:SAM-dependent methyltransferase
MIRLAHLVSSILIASFMASLGPAAFAQGHPAFDYDALEKRRDAKFQQYRLLDIAGVEPGMAVGEVGAGDGYLTFHLAARVGPAGKVYANDIVEEMALEVIRSRAKAKGITNIETVLGAETDPRFPRGSLDRVFFLNSFHEIREPVELLRNLVPSLKPGAIVVIHEWEVEEPGSPGPGGDRNYTRQEILDIIAKSPFQVDRIETGLPGPRPGVLILSLKNRPAALRAPPSGPFGCTIVMAARDGRVLAGNNEDRNHPQTVVTFIPASGSYHGRVVFGYDDAYVQGGMNDQGLFIDANALRPTGWRPEPGRPTFSSSVMMVVLATCATCEDVKAFFEKSNFPALGQARFPVADRSGASMVVEYGQDRVQFVKSDTWYQIATNFVISNVMDGNFPCWRYRTADTIMSGAKGLSVGLIREVLERTRQEGNSRTVYSNIYDLKQGTVHVYNLGNFEEVVVMDLAEELKKGQRRLELRSLFKPRSQG